MVSRWLQLDLDGCNQGSDNGFCQLVMILRPTFRGQLTIATLLFITKKAELVKGILDPNYLILKL